MSTTIPDYAYAEERTLTEIAIPTGIASIGRHAFYNCRALQRIVLPHGGIEVGDGAFKNCRQVSEIHLMDGSGDVSCLKSILSDLNQDVEVRIHYKGGEEARLLFPHFEYEYIANEPARIFSEIGYGSGYIYQQCFYDSQIDFKRYDSLWSRAVVDEEIPVLAAILYDRLAFPYQLSESHRANYERYFQEHPKDFLFYMVDQERKEMLSFFLEDAPTSGNEQLPHLTEWRKIAREIALQRQHPSIISYILELEHHTGNQSATAFSRFAL